MRKMEHILSLSYGKDSLACLGAIEKLGWPLDRIIHVEVWATDTIPADLPPMVEFKDTADAIIKERYGIEVEHLCAMKDGKKLTYEKMFYHVPKRSMAKRNNDDWVEGAAKGFPLTIGSWCKKLKTRVNLGASKLLCTGADMSIIRYLGIAADEPERIERHTKAGAMLPLVESGWTEVDCRKWCERNDLLSPIYNNATRGGCWFCHYQGVQQLRLLRHNYPEYWALMLKWDDDSPVKFKADGHTVHDYERRFQLEDDGLISKNDKVFRWSMLDEELNYRLF